MPPVAPIFKSVTATGDTAMAAATETIVATLSGITLPDPTMTVSLHGDCSVLTGVGGTNVVLRIRRTGLTGTLVGEGNPHNIGASLSSRIPIDFDDQPGDVAGQVYVLTATSAVGAATCTDASLNAVIHT